jgi:hypothetical protein
MLGFIIGAVVVIGVVKAVRRARGGFCGHAYGCGPGMGPRFGGGGWGGHRQARGYGRSRWAMRWLFQRLETTPGQEKAIVAALEELRQNRAVVREELRQTRADLGRVLEGGLVDDAALEETFARHDRLLAPLRVSFVEALKKVTEALDDGQRRELARMLKGGGWFGRGAWGGDGDGDVWA